jgi:uncharacterized membrane protein
LAVAEESTPRPRDSQGRFLSQEETEVHSEETEVHSEETEVHSEATEMQQQPAETQETSEPPPSDAYAPTEVAETQPSARPPAEDDQDNRLDAMGLDKRRQVVGQSYGPSLAKQATLYGAFLAVLVGLVIGGKLLADELDKPPEKNEDVAPWSRPDAPQIPSKPLQ